MKSMYALEFLYGKRKYSAIVKIEIEEGLKAYYVTIINGLIENFLTGDQPVYTGELFGYDSTSRIDRYSELKRCIINAIEEQFHMNFSLN